MGFTAATPLVHELIEARDERRLLNLQRQLSRLNLLIIDELGFVPLSRTVAEPLFEVSASASTTAALTPIRYLRSQIRLNLIGIEDVGRS